MVNERYQQELYRLLDEKRYRVVTEINPANQSSFCTIGDGQEKLINLCSNDYLSLSENASLLDLFYKQGGTDSIDRFKLGAASSRLLTGSNRYTANLENDLARKYGRDASLVFNSGYHANIGILSALSKRKDLILSDKLNHASLYDGVRLSQAKGKRYSHNDYDHLEFILKKERINYEEVFVVTESVFSMDGDCADLERLVMLKHKYDLILYVDEAHAVGLYGRAGLGKSEEKGLVSEIDLLIGTFGKAFASIGAFVICDSVIREYLINHSRSFIFTTALPPVIINWNRFILDLLHEKMEERAHLEELSNRFREELREYKLKTAGTTNIIPVIIGDINKTVDVAAKMQEKGFLMLPVRPPTVPEGSSRLRLSLTAGLSWNDLKAIPFQLAGEIR